MAKKVILTQKQLDEICGGDSSYLDGIGTDFRKDGTNAVYTGEKRSDGSDDEPMTTKDVDLTLPKPPYYYYWRNIPRTRYFESKKSDWAKKNLREANETNISIDPTTKKNMVAGPDSAGANAVKNGVISHTNATTIKNRMEKLKDSIKKGNEQALNKYNNMGGDVLYDKLNRELENKTTINQRDKQNQKNLGIQTDIRDYGNGKGHSEEGVLLDNPYKTKNVSALGESRSIKSAKLQDIINKHGGFYKDSYLRGRKSNHDIRMTNADLHNLTDDQVIDVVDYTQIKPTIENIRQNKLYGFVPGDDIDYVQLNDGNYLLLMVKNANQYRNRDYQKGDFQDLVDKKIERDRNRPYKGKHNDDYQWKSTDAQHYVFNNPYYKNWDKEAKEQMRRKIKDDYKKQ